MTTPARPPTRRARPKRPARKKTDGVFTVAGANISLANILTALALIGTVAIAWLSLDKRVVTLETKNEASLDNARRLERAASDLRSEYRADLAGINVKLDKLIERAAAIDASPRR